ncbi:MAG: ATP-binding protein [Desulfosudaceae bacterium]
MFKRKKLLTRLFFTYLLITFASLLIVTWYMLGTLNDFFVRETHRDLVARAELVREYVGSPGFFNETGKINSFCREAGRASRTRITVIRPDGRVLGDTDKNVREMDSHANRPEVIEAVRTGRGSAVRYSNTLGTKMMYVAIPVRQEGQLRLIIRTSVPLSSVYGALAGVKTQIVSAGLLVALLVVLAGFLISRQIVRPIMDMKRGAERFAAGDLDRKLPLPDTEELAVLAATLNDMAAELDDTIKLIQRQKNELETVFASLTEAVIAVDNDQKILRLNRAAEHFSGSPEAELKGKYLYEIIRNHALARFADTAAHTRAARQTEDDIIFEINGKDHIVNTRSAPLVDETRQRLGTLLVLTDVTRVRRLENMRKDFAANVSHEIKTPLTSIKGFAEALLSDPESTASEATVRHLDIILKNAERLSAIVEDVLRLSRIEHGDRQKDFCFTNTKLASVIDSAVNSCRLEAGRKNIRIRTECDPDLEVCLDFSLLEQALVNLLANAVKYSHDNGEVSITVRTEGRQVAIAFADNGPGIEASHIPRLFERFYRVDRARSRKLGGTGLGLAIVKHVVQIHGGTIEVGSTPGQGSVFTVIIPREQAD